MERPAWAARVLRPNQYDAELAKNPLNDYLLAGQKSALKDSRCVYKECLYSMLDAVQQSEIYPYLATAMWMQTKRKRNFGTRLTSC